MNMHEHGNCAAVVPLVLDILLAGVDGHIAQLDDFLQPLLQVLDVALLLGHKLSEKTN